MLLRCKKLVIVTGLMDLRLLDIRIFPRKAYPTDIFSRTGLQLKLFSITSSLRQYIRCKALFGNSLSLCQHYSKHS